MISSSASGVTLIDLCVNVLGHNISHLLPRSASNNGRDEIGGIVGIETGVLDRILHIAAGNYYTNHERLTVEILEQVQEFYCQYSDKESLEIFNDVSLLFHFLF
jgi:hypothetical protein